MERRQLLFLCFLLLFVHLDAKDCHQVYLHPMAMVYETDIDSEEDALSVSATAGIFGRGKHGKIVKNVLKALRSRCQTKCDVSTEDIDGMCAENVILPLGLDLKNVTVNVFSTRSVVLEYLNCIRLAFRLEYLNCFTLTFRLVFHMLECLNCIRLNFYRLQCLNCICYVCVYMNMAHLAVISYQPQRGVTVPSGLDEFLKYFIILDCLSEDENGTEAEEEMKANLMQNGKTTNSNDAALAVVKCMYHAVTEHFIFP
ncbi:hypothetical protein L9F63_012317 [Diploptera punctata]|uniref:Uncharacterized protein n=1 Tax=Diploptera punctata TaxID=6984 RepID=A0AAD8EMW4_DIPPU|nr:hypothetical protein L9F63_012317 [Diploptera punctata]